MLGKRVIFQSSAVESGNGGDQCRCKLFSSRPRYGHPYNELAHDGRCSHIQTLRGHMSNINTIKFNPCERLQLVSYAMSDNSVSLAVESQIIFWDIQKQMQKRQRYLDDTEVKSLARKAAQTVALGSGNDMFPIFRWSLTTAEQTELALEFENPIKAINTRAQIRDNRKLHGRLQSDFGSHVFDSKGTSIAFLPGDRPRSNSDDKWDIFVYDTVKNEVRLALVGHRDAIMWIGFSPDGQWIASVSWDKTFRIWSHANGRSGKAPFMLVVVLSGSSRPIRSSVSLFRVQIRFEKAP